MKKIQEQEQKDQKEAEQKILPKAEIYVQLHFVYRQYDSSFITLNLISHSNNEKIVYSPYLNEVFHPPSIT